MGNVGVGFGKQPVQVYSQVPSQTINPVNYNLKVMTAVRRILNYIVYFSIKRDTNSIKIPDLNK